MPETEPTTRNDEPMGPPEPPADGRRPLSRNPWFLAALFGIITITAIRPFLRHIPEAPPVIGQLPSFELVNQDGEPFGSQDLRGTVYVAHTFFTHCQTVCPPLMTAMAGLQERYEQEERARREPLAIHLVSITVDPFNDSPERLRETALEYGASFDRWTLLTGEESVVRDLVVNGFMTDMGEAEVSPDDANLIDISHSGRVVLVDAAGGIRGYYGTDASGLDEVYHRSLHLIRDMQN